MRTLILSFVLLFILIPVKNFGQEWEWGKSISSDGNVVTVDIETDASHNVYIVGIVKDATSFTIGTDTYTVKGLWDAFICSYTADGIYRWSKQIAGLGSDMINGIEIDQYDSIYIAGSYKNSALYFTSSDSLENSSKFDAFIAKYSTDGSLAYAKRAFKGDKDQRILNIKVNEAAEEIAVIGNFKTELTYLEGGSETTITPVVAGNTGLFVATFSYDSIFKDIATYDVTDSYSNLKSIAVCKAGGYFITGDLRGRINFTGTEFIEGEGINSEAMVFRVDDNLDYLWARLGRGTGYDHVNWAVSDIYSNIYITGKTESSPTTFDSTDVLAGAPLAAYGGSDMYIAKYNRSGVLQWARRNGDAGNDNTYGADVTDEFFYFIGNFAGEVKFGQDTVNTGSIDNIDVGLGVMDLDGNAISVAITSGDTSDFGTGLIASEFGSVSLTGVFGSSVLTAGSIELNNPSARDHTDGFVLNYLFPYSAVFTEIKNITCNGDSDGELIVTPHFGLPPYSYAWDHDGTLEDSIATALSAGDYRVIITDDLGRTAEASVTLIQPDPIDLTETVTDIVCYGHNTGEIAVDISGGTEPYTIEWTGPSFSSNLEDITNLYGGSYTIDVSDALGCETQGVYAVNQNDRIIFNGTDTTTIVAGNDGAIDLVVSGGTGVISTFVWTGPTGFPGSSSKDLSALDIGGLYSVTVTDQLGCTGDTSMMVSDSRVLFAYVDTVKNISCLGGNDGFIRVSAINGTRPYSWSWDHNAGLTDSVASGLSAGNYRAVVTDINSNTSEVNITITTPATGVNVVLNQVNDITCFGADDGSITVNPSGGTMPYKYSWTGTGDYTSDSKDIFNLGHGFYSLTVTDINGCFAVIPGGNSVEIKEPEVLGVSVEVLAEPLCHGVQAGELKANVTGGTGTSVYLWDDQGHQTTQVADFLEARTYNVKVTDIHNCTAQANGTITSPSEIVISGQINNISCGATTGDIITTVSGGTPPYSYVWYDEMDAIVVATKDLLGQSAGTYRLLVTDANNCTQGYGGTIQQLTDFVIDEIINSDCSIKITVLGGQPPYQYSIDGGINYQADSLFGPSLEDGSYSVFVKDVTDCEVNGGLVVITGCSLTIVSIDTTNCSILIGASGGIWPYEFSIDAGLNYQPDSLFESLESGSYTVYVRDQNGYVADSIVQAGCFLPLTIFNAFSPGDDDDYNRLWNIPGIEGYPDCIIKVYNAWGTVVFNSPVGYPDPWDGKLSNGKIVPAGTYYYVIDLGDGSRIRKGTLSVVK